VSEAKCYCMEMLLWKCYYVTTKLGTVNEVAAKPPKTVNCDSTDAQIGMLLNLISASLCQKKRNCYPTGEDKKA